MAALENGPRKWFDEQGIDLEESPWGSLVADVSLTLLVLKTRQVERLRTFYHALGIELKQERHGKGPTHYTGQVGALVLEVYPLPVDARSADPTTRLGFSVANLTAVVEALQAIGTPVVTQPRATPWGYRAVVRDPDGRAVEL